MGLIVRILMVAAGILTGWVIAKDEPLFGTVQIFVTLALMAVIVAAVAFWPKDGLTRLRRFWNGP